MPIEQMNIPLSSRMARFIRSKVKKGDYTNASEVVRNAVRRLQVDESAGNYRAQPADFETHLPAVERDDIRRSVQRGNQGHRSGPV